MPPTPSPPPPPPALRLLKTTLRKRVTAALRTVPPPVLAAESAAVTSALLAHPAYVAASSVAVYASMPAVELDTGPLVAAAAEAGKRIFFPRVLPAATVSPRGTRIGGGCGSDGDAGSVGAAVASAPLPDNAMAFFPCTGGLAELNTWDLDRWGIRQPPIRGDPAGVRGADLDLVVVPGVAFDAAGRRLGHGKGYYDTWLAGVAADVRRDASGRRRMPVLIGLALSVQMVDEVPVDELDVRMDDVLCVATLGEATS
ncbi:hypothetical protein I4F81_005850 [Pyropia yezoensis]|uniref:Uncharacterized protein n=1 Tax=Pyropia yezoensis TaxID=2788 RepID=A0ACC3C0H1_PYRYE|nr:hypothetical protein I4F81_005850 [Neopyropia yezoensis]